MPISSRDREPDPPPEDAVQAPRGELTRPGPPNEEPEPGPDAATDTAAPEDEHAVALQEAEDRWRRALADLDNLRKRHARELKQEAAAERARTAAAFLPVIDNLELALSHAAADSGAIVEGIRAVRDEAVNVLERLGYPRDTESGVPFDPTRHEVVGVVQDPDADPNTVVQVLRPGYGQAERQLRPAAVTVTKRE